MIRYIGTAHSFECGDWFFTIMRMPRGSYEVVLVREGHEVWRLEYRDLLLDSGPTVTWPVGVTEEEIVAGGLDGIPNDVLREVEHALCAVERGEELL